MEGSTINYIRSVGKAVYKTYVGIGIAAMAIMAGCVIYSVIARYFFGISHTFLEEFITTVFAFTTFWGMGICVMENEHVIIDSVYNLFPPKAKKLITIFNYLVVLLMEGILMVYGAKYALKFGHQISMGMRIPMLWMYGIIPLGSAIGMVCVLIKLIEYILQEGADIVRADQQ